MSEVRLQVKNLCKSYIYGQKRLLPCDMSFDTFFIDPFFPDMESIFL